MKSKDIKEAKEFDLELGNKGAQVSSTRGFKKWASGDRSGLTVEATVTVQLTCNQDEHTITLAAEMANAMAEHHAREGIKEMSEYFTD